MKKADVLGAIKSINKFTGGPVIILPGNHDFISNDNDLWRYVEGGKNEHVIILAEKKPYDLENYDLNVCIYPAPCSAKHSSENEVGWIEETDIKNEKLNIGVAHGSLQGVAPDLNDEHFPMTREELSVPGIDTWLLGHIHIPWPDIPSANDNIFYSGIPEPEDMNCKHKGSALIIEFDDNREKSVEIIVPGQNYFERKSLVLESSEDMDDFAEVTQSEDYQNCVCKLTVTGSLDPDDYVRWYNEVLPEIKKSFLYLKTEDSGLRQKITKERLDGIYPEGSFPHKLLSDFLKDNDQQALETAFDLFKDIKDEN
jgi:DNA repair exonuclease SbcCD nuclease subunit